MPQLSLATVRALIRENKEQPQWEADETPVSHVAREERPGMAFFGIGASDDELRSVHESMMVFPGMAPPPSSIDWRNYSGKNFVTGVRNQLNCGSCVAFATCAALESRDAVRGGTQNPTLDLSEAHLFYCGCQNCCAKGWQPVLALDFAQNTGVGLESAFPYTPGNQPCRSGVAPQIRIVAHTAAFAPTARRVAIAGAGPVIGAMKVFRDFMYYKEGVYTPVTDDLLGLHAICVIGYDDIGKYWIIKNSWGPGWGAGGYARIAYGTTCELDGSYPFWVPEL
jgi:C1A family cysteine protease